MPKRNDIHKVLIIGSGPIVIGQACEFDYSGTQACKALRSLGYEIVLVNSNPATIMTDPGMADRTYIEPLNLERLTQIIEKERPDALLPNLGGQTGLNLAAELNKAGILQKYNVKIIGVQADAIERGEDRLAFKETMQKLGIDLPKSELAYSVEEAEKIVEKLGFPVVIRPAYTLGGTGGGMAFNLEELRTIASRGLSASLIGQILIEESVLGWEELELEVVRDSNNNMITVCFIENIDAMGIHTGDSFCSAPMLTIPEDVQKILQNYAYKVVEAIQVIGGTNVQFARDPKSGRIVIIEINPRTSRSSALASKATGFPIARVSALLAAGITLNEIPYWRKGTLDQYTPYGDYVVIKFARWAFEKFKGSIDKLGTQMRAVGEVMSIGKTYKEAFQKAIRSLEINRYGLGFAKNFNSLPLSELLQKLAEPSSERQFILYEALRKGANIEELYKLTHIKPWFLQQMKELVELEEQIIKVGKNISNSLLAQAKKDGFSDKYLAKLTGLTEQQIRQKRKEANIKQVWHEVKVSGVQNACYYYSTYNSSEDTILPESNKNKVMILGGGPNRIGQGIEFDYCCCHAAYALREAGYQTIMVNCNPETVSTDYDTADRLYFEPLTVEDVIAIYEKEKPLGAIVQFGGQTPLNIAEELQNEGVNILGTSVKTIAIAEDRDLFRKLMEKLKIPMPQSGIATSPGEAAKIANHIGYPLMVRPSFVLGGRGMEIIHDEETLLSYVRAAAEISPDKPILIDRFLQDALEVETDALCDGHSVFIPTIMEHIEFAGVHSGDSACVIPPVSLSEKHQKTIYDYTERIALALNVKGLINIQFAIENDVVYVLEANPRASRTVPLVSKVCGIQLAAAATKIIMGTKLSELNLKKPKLKHFGVKESVFPFNMYPEVDPILGPEMRSTGEVLGIAESFPLAYFKAQEAAKPPLPTSGTVFISTREKTKLLEQIGIEFQKLNFKILATEGTHNFFQQRGIKSEIILKLHEGRPNVNDAILNKQINLIINTPSGKSGFYDDSYIRKSAIKYKIPYITTLPAALAAVRGIAAYRQGKTSVKSLQEYHTEIS